MRYCISVTLAFVLLLTSAHSDIIFQDDFSEANGTAMHGKPADVGGAWSSSSWANQVQDNSFVQIGSGSIASRAIFSRALGAGQTLTVTIEAGPGSVFSTGGWSGLTLTPLGGGGSISFGDGGSNDKWEETNTGPSTADGSAPNTVIITYAYDTGVWTLNTSALPGLATGTATAGLSLQELHVWDDGAGGSAIQYNSITVESTALPLEGYAAWSEAYALTTGPEQDEDGDGLSNFAEYAQGGDPTDSTKKGHQPFWSMSTEVSNQWLYYTYPRNADADDVKYALELSEHLSSSRWAKAGYAVFEGGADSFAPGFEAVTNRVPMEGYQSRFLRLEMTEAAPLPLRGGDISMIPRMEELGGQYRDADVPDDPIRIMMNHGMNFFRVRLFVTPDGAWDGAIQDLSYVTALGQRIKNAGAKFLLDIHYSDTWADPGHQDKPASWASLSFSELEAEVEAYSSHVIATLKQAGCLPDMVQVGNEITGGFLWPEGKIYNEPLGGWANFTTLLKAGIRGVKQPLEDGEAMEIMVHIDRGGDSGATQFFYGKLDEYGVEYDVIGLSFYPWWHGTLADLENTLQNAAHSFGKEIIVVETAFPWQPAVATMQWPQTPQGQKEFAEDVIEVIDSTPNGLGKGIVWWYPEAVNDVPISIWYGGGNALFDSNWNALPALEAF